MADINSYLENIQNAVYGEDVRDSIHDALEAINEENAVVKADAIEIKSDLDTKASTTDLNAESTAREAADEALTEAIANKASADGSYEGMTVGSSEQLLSDSYTEDKVPYHFRASGGNGADREYDEIVGGTVAWNQLTRAIDSAIPNKGVTVTLNDDGSVTINGTSNASGALTAFRSFDSINGHKYLITMKGLVSGLSVFTSVGSTGLLNSPTVRMATADGVADATLRTDSGVTYDNVKAWVNVHDLTAMFGTTIADYIYNLETATAGAGVAFFRKLFPKEYYPYSAGELKSVEGVSAHEMVGFNQWDEEWLNGYHNSATGVFVSNANYICSKNLIRVLPSTTYYFNTNGEPWEIYEYGVSGNYLRLLRSAIVDSTFVPDADTHFIHIGSHNQATTYNHDICINLSDPSKNGTYEPYVKHTYPLDDSLTLRGIPKLDASNNLYFDGDTYEADGTVTRRYGVVDLGTLSWVYDTTNQRFQTDSIASLVKRPTSWGGNAICAKYLIDSGNPSDKHFNIYLTGRLYVKDTAYTDAATFKTAMSGVMLVYELATPTTETAEPYEALQIVDPYGTEEYVSTGIVPVGHDTKYPDNLKAKIEGLPWNFATLIAPTETSYKATQNYTTGALFIVSNILYKATANIANGGTITPGTNCTATTLAEVISALA